MDFLRLRAALDEGWLCLCLSRAVLLLVAVELITMPVTQHYWAWDQFMHGGQDFELTLLMVVTCGSFMLLRTQICRQTLGLLLAMGICFLLIIRRRNPGRSLRFGRLLIDSRKTRPDGPPALHDTPLLI